MADDGRTLRRLRLLARLRQIQHRNAAAKAFSAVAQRQRSDALAERAHELSRSYDVRPGLDHGHDLVSRSITRMQTAQLARQTEQQARSARERADDLIASEREARRRRDRVQEESERVAREQSRAALAREDVGALLPTRRVPD